MRSRWLKRCCRSRVTRAQVTYGPELGAEQPATLPGGAGPRALGIPSLAEASTLTPTAHSVAISQRKAATPRWLLLAAAGVVLFGLGLFTWQFRQVAPAAVSNVPASTLPVPPVANPVAEPAAPPPSAPPPVPVVVPVTPVPVHTTPQPTAAVDAGSARQPVGQAPRRAARPSPGPSARAPRSQQRHRCARRATPTTTSGATANATQPDRHGDPGRAAQRLPLTAS